MASSPLKFTINGEQHTVKDSDVCSDTMLLDYCRNYLNLRGTKYMCREGGCGACTVTAAKTPGSKHVAINSCLTSIASCHGWDIRTIEGLGNKKDGYHTLQKTIAENNATQCGYCTPGWVMMMHGLMESHPNPLTKLEIEKSVSSNLCRCTGYRPILDAFKLLATDADKDKRITNITDVSCKPSGGCCQSANNAKEDGWCMVRQDDYHEEELMKIELKDKKTWYRPRNLADVCSILKDNTESYMLVAGNSSKGAYPIEDYPDCLIDVHHLQELRGCEIDQNCEIGAGCSMTEFMQYLKDNSTKEYFGYFKQCYDHMDLVGHVTLRNVATIAGNLMIKHTYNAYQSDVYLIFNTVGAYLTLKDFHGNDTTVTMEEFLATDMKGKIIVKVLLPPLTTEYKLYTYKLMPRAQSSHAIVNLGFLVKLDDSDVVQESRIIYGALSEKFDRAVSTETYLKGRKLFCDETLQGALKVLDGEMIVEDHPPEPSAEYRRFIAKALFYKALLCLSPKRTARCESATVDLHITRPVSEGKQSCNTDASLWPFNKPMPKLEAMVQSSGEAKYTDDIPTHPNEVFAALVLTTVGKGVITKIDPSEALAMDGVVAFYTSKDIPGVNSFTPSDSWVTPSNEEILCEGTVKYCGQPYGIIVANTQNLADRAARRVKATYSNVTEPVTDINVAKDDSTRNTLYVAVDATNPGTDTVYKTITGTNILHGQYHFPMETMVCVAKPTEEGLEVHMATQWPDGAHTMISRALNMDQNKIELHVRRVGGSYGLKITRCVLGSIVCSLIAQKLNRPCRLLQPLTTNMKAFGKRMPSVNVYEVAVNSSGVIQYLNNTSYTDNGCVVSEPVIAYGFDVYHNVYDTTRINYKAYNTVTDTPSNTFCRSPGTLEAIANCENIMERISYELSIDPFTVRLNNINKTKYPTIVELLETIKTNAEYVSRKAAVDSYNTENRWKKRGLRCAVVRWPPVGGLYIVVNIAVYHSDGSVVITHGGIEMGQGINTKIAQVAAYLLKVPIEKIVVKGNDTVTSPNTFITGGSVSTDALVIGTRRCCEQLLTRLEPVKATLDEPTWLQLITAAYAANVDLQVHGFACPTDAQSYEIFGAALCEVEVDVLTGEIEILRVDIIQDIGVSISPEVDIGQIEGAFVMGLGYWTCEKIAYDSKTGAILTDRSWDYHLPEARDIPQKFNIICRNDYSNDLILGSKAVGEPPICLSVVITHAIREACVSARQDNGIPTTEYFAVEGAFSTEKICMAMKTKTEDFKF
ncbi:hypothetical protein PYW07_012003 [Mythimna separata]|uniref:Uncharacterized protein n=1 Tax=Mythimna separata TaxID=271217 RepID=A0AAD7YLE1_MYTSE|nr:hypothetical protein PYW07_012003 [Mythimna separata]